MVAELQSRLGRALVFSGHGDEATGPIEAALTLAQHHGLAESLAFSLNSKAALLMYGGRAEEARLNFEGALGVARRHKITERELIAESNLADLCMIHDLPGAEEHAYAALGLARRWGRRANEATAALNLMYILTMAGRLDEAHQLGTEVLQSRGDQGPGAADINFALACLEAMRGNDHSAREHLAGCHAWAESDDVQDRSDYASAEAAVLLAEGDSRRALETARRAIDEILNGGLAVAHEAVRIAFPVALEAATDLDEPEEAKRLAGLLAARPRGEVPPFLRAQLRRAKALVAGARDEDEDVEANLVAAETAFRELGYPYWTARAQLDRAEWLAGQGRHDESAGLAGEAETIFDAVGAAPMLARARGLLETEYVASLSGVESPT